ncbi:MAG: ABC transporter permease [Ginsengibacter sp.]
MIKSYFKIAIRSLVKNRLISFINIFGLGLSMSVGMMIMIRLQDQLSYDRFHPYPERTYRIISSYHKKNGEQWKMASTPLPLNVALTSDVNSIENSVNIYPAFNGKATGAGKELYLNGAFTEPSFLKIFGFSLASGNPATALQMPNTMIVTKTTAQKFFGTADAVGKVIAMDKGGNFTITGVLNDLPGKSHISFDAYASYASVAQMEKDKLLPGNSTNWYAFQASYTYVLLKKGFKTSTLIQQLKPISDELNRQNKEGKAGFEIQPINKITPGRSDLDNNIGSGTSWTKLYFEISVSLIILLAACFNYTNLTIARALTRAKEVGVRKIVGAKRYQVFIQYVVESILLALFALAFAWLLLSFIVNYAPFNDDYEFIPSAFRYNAVLVFWSLCFAIFTGLLAGTVPAWILSAFKPLRVLKNLSTAKILGKISVQKTLIVFQYSLSLVIIIFLFVFYKQFSFMSASDSGFKKNNVLILALNGSNENIISQKISAISGVKSVSATSASFSKHFQGMSSPVWMNNKQHAFPLNYYYADEHFIPSLNFNIIAGKNFPPESGRTGEQYIIINEKAATALGFKDYEKAVGQKLWITDSTRLEITGVLKDFNYESAGKSVAPLAFRNKKDAYNYLYIETGGKNKQALTGRIEQAWKTFMPSQPVSISWLDEEINKSNSQLATISLLGYLAFMAIAIASLGLLGLVIYTVEVKRKEISIRKIIGADKGQLIRMLSRGFIKLLFIAGLIAMPIGYIAGFLFLQGFASRVNFGIFNVMICFLFLLSIGLITIISQTYKAAIANPVTSLRTE